MTKENVLKIIATVGALIAAVITMLWPAQAGTYGEILKLVLEIAFAVVALIFPVESAAKGIYGAAAKANYYAAVRDGKIKPRGASGDIPDLVLTYTLADIPLILDYVLAVARQVSGSTNPAKSMIAGNFVDRVQYYDLRPIKDRYQRVPLMKALAEKAMELLKEAWDEFKIPVPLPEVCAAPARHMFELKKAYQAANNQVCGDPVFAKMRLLLGDLNEMYELQYGLEQISDKTVDWSIFDWNSQVGVGLIRENWAKMLY